MVRAALICFAALLPGLAVDFPPPGAAGRGGTGLEKGGPLFLRAAAAFSPGELPGTSGLYLLDKSGNLLASDFIATARWEDGSVRALVIRAALPARSAGGSVRLLSGRNMRGGGPVISMEKKGDSVTVNTGLLKMTLDGGSPRFITRADLAGREIASLDEGIEFRLRLDGSVYRPGRSLLVLSRGCARGRVLFSGRFFDGSGAAGPFFTVAFGFLAGSGTVDCRVALDGGLFRGEDAGVFIGLTPPWRNPSAPVRIIAGKERTSLAPKGGNAVSLVSRPGLVEALMGKKKLSFTSSGDAGMILTGSSPRLVLFLPLFGRLHPWDVTVRPGGALTLSLLNKCFSWEPFFSFERHFSLSFAGRKFSGPAGFDAGGPPAFRLSSDPGRRTFLFAEGGTTKDGGHLGGLFLKVTSAMKRRLRGEWKSWDGFRNYGDSRKAWGEWANEEYDPVFGLMKRFLWTCDKEDFEMARVVLRHWLRYDRAGREDPKAPEGTFWMHGKRHRTGRFEAGHVWLDGLLLYHAMTGDEASIDAARCGGAFLENEAARFRTTKLERSVSWTLTALAALVEAGEDRFETAMDRTAEILRSRLTAKGIPAFRTALSGDEECYEVNTWVTAGITVEALYRHWRVTGDRRSFACAVRTARAVLRGSFEAGENVFYQRIFVSKGTGAVVARDGVVTGGKLALVALGAARAFELSGEENFRELGRSLMSRALSRLAGCPPRCPGEDLTLLLRVGLDGIEVLEGGKRGT